MPSFPAPAAIRVVVEVTGTLVRVTAAERADTVVVIEPVDPVNRQHAEVAARTTAEFGAGELIVRTRRSGARTGAGSRWRGRPAVLPRCAPPYPSQPGRSLGSGWMPVLGAATS